MSSTMSSTMPSKQATAHNKKTENTVQYIVGVGASAGGLEAIDTFFSHMPTDTGLAFIVIQHLSPDYKSLMVELLSKVTEIPVLRAENGMKVKKNHIYLNPPKMNMTIFHNKIMLTEQNRESGVLNLPIDIFFKSLAEDQQSQAIAIILSGTGSDGMRGLKRIKEGGGMVMVQDEESAKFDGMPRSAISTGLCDFILPPQEMSDKLVCFIKHPYSQQKETPHLLLSDEDGLTRIYYLIREKCKVDFTNYKNSTFIRRLERRMQVNQISELKDYVRLLEHYPTEINNLFRELLISVTQFFRDREVFNKLENKWLPKLFEQSRSDEIRIWVSGCATGEEAYSIAILCREISERTGINKDIKIFATDVDQDALQKAGAGIYPESILADLPTNFAAKYFFLREERYQVARVIREMVVFAKHDLLKDPPFTNIDMVTCRNLLIYFQPVLQKRALEMFNFSLKADGILLLGSSETTGELTAYFETLETKEKIYQSKGKRHAPLSSIQLGKYANRPTGMTKRLEYSPQGQHSMDEKILDRFLQSITNIYIPLTVVVNDALEVIHTFGETGQYFSLPMGRMENNLIKMSRKELSIPLATGIPKVFKSRDELRYSNIKIKMNSESIMVNIHLVPLPEKRNQISLVAVFIQDVRALEQTPNSPSNVVNYDVDKEADQRIHDLEQELQYTRENLQATVEELETSNEELQATNEELLASNEELQSTNEELQSVNEELYTVNAEHQSKIVELIELNNDLDNLLISTDIATIFLDEELEVRKFTPSIEQIFKILDTDIGRPVSHISHKMDNMDFLRYIEQVKSSNEVMEVELQTNNRQWFMMRILPYHIAPNVFSGVVVTFMNINNFKTIEKDLIYQKRRCTLAQHSAHFGVWDWNMCTNEVFWTDSIEPMFGLSEGQFDKTLDGFMNYIHSDDIEQFQIKLDGAIADNSDFKLECRIIQPDNTERWIVVSAHIQEDERGDATHMIGIVSDVTDRKLIEINLKHSEFIFRSTLENLDMLAVQLDAQANITFVNNFFLKVVGYSREEVMGCDWVELFIPQRNKKKVKKVFADILNTEKPLAGHYENLLVCKDGTEYPLWWNNTALLDEEGISVGITSIGEDVSLRDKMLPDEK